MSRMACVIVGIVFAVVVGYAALPHLTSMALEWLLERHGYEHVMIEIGYPGWSATRISLISLQKNLGAETLTLLLKESELQYRVPELFSANVTRIAISEASVELKGAASSQVTSSPDTAPLSFTMLTVDDLLETLPILPFDEFILKRLTVFREQATGPLREMIISCVLQQGDEGVRGEVSFAGRDTAAYQLTFSGKSLSTMALTLRSQRPQAVPIIAWRSDVVPSDFHVSLQGAVEINVRELAPYLALMLPIGSEWETISGTVTANWSGTASPSVALSQMWRDVATQVHGSVQLDLALPRLEGLGRGISLKFAGEGTGNARRVAWSIAPDSSFTVKALTVPMPDLIRTALPPGDQPFSINALRPVAGELLLMETPATFSMEGPVRVTYGSSRAPLNVEMTATRASGRGREMLSADGTFRIAGRMPKLAGGALSAKQVTGQLRGTVALDHGQLRVAVLEPSTLTVSQMQQGNMKIPHGTIQIEESLPMQVDISSGTWMAGPAAVRVLVPKVNWNHQQIRIRDAGMIVHKLQGSANTWNANGALSFTGVSLAQVRSVPTTNWKLQFTADPTSLKTDLHADVQDRGLSLTAHIEHGMTTRQGSVHAGIGPVRFTPTGTQLSTWAMPWSYPFDITDGQVSATVDATWIPDAKSADQAIQLKSGTATVVLDQIAGRYREMFINGLTTTLNLQAQGFETITMPQPTKVTIGTVKTGVDLTDIAMTLQLGWNIGTSLPVVEVRDLRSALFGGEVTSEGFRADLSRLPYSLVLKLRRLDLQKILNLEQQKDLQGTGILEGVVPVTITAAGVRVENGTVEARPPGGVIRYHLSEETIRTVTQSEANMRLVLQALNNFHYNVLQVGVQYAEDGTLNLKSRLEGKNPELKQGRPIHFNLTVQENIPALLKSLRLVQDIEQSLEQRFKRR